VYESEITSAKLMDIDYDRYGKGESLLGWLNGSVSFRGNNELDGNRLLASIAERLGKSVDSAGGEIAHMKMTINPVGDPYEIAAISLVRGGEEAEFSHRLSEPLEDGEILLNMRAEFSPELLSGIAVSTFKEVLEGKLGLDYSIDSLEHFRPGQPVPTHRMTSL